jgi:hypothetical protein
LTPGNAFTWAALRVVAIWYLVPHTGDAEWTPGTFNSELAIA